MVSRGIIACVRFGQLHSRAASGTLSRPRYTPLLPTMLLARLRDERRCSNASFAGCVSGRDAAFAAKNADYFRANHPYCDVL